MNPPTNAVPPGAAMTGRKLLVLCFAAAIAVSCGGGSAPAEEATSSEALITAADLRPGFVPVPGEPVVPTESDRQECVAALDALEVSPSRDPQVAEERVLLRDEAGTAVQHVVRRYPALGAASEYDRLTALLATCARFVVRDPSGLRIDETVATVTPPTVAGARTWAAGITVTAQGATFPSTLVLLQRGAVLSSVSVFTPFAPERDLTLQAVAAAGRRLP